MPMMTTTPMIDRCVSRASAAPCSASGLLLVESTLTGRVDDAHHFCLVGAPHRVVALLGRIAGRTRRSAIQTFLSSLTGLLLCAGVTNLYADEVYSKNQRANQLYDKGKYEAALKLYESALLASPKDERLKANQGSAQYRLGQFDKAEESYLGALTEKDKNALADAHYNLGNALFREGQQLAQGGGEGAQGAQEKLKSARDNYVKTLDLRPSDKDAKWNLQIAEAVLKQMEKQQKQDNKDQDKKDQDKQKQDQQQSKDDKQKQDQNKQDKDKQNQDKQKQDQQQAKNDQQKQDKDKQPQPQSAEQKQQDQKKQQAAALLAQFADDDKLNKPMQKVPVAGEKKPEKDW